MPDEKVEQKQRVSQVTLDEVLREVPSHAPREVGPLTRVGYKLAIFVLIYMAVVTVILLVEYLLHAPLLFGNSALDAAQLTQYEKLSQIATDRTLRLLDALVLKGFLPVLTAVLGYIFGTRGADREES